MLTIQRAPILCSSEVGAIFGKGEDRMVRAGVIGVVLVGTVAAGPVPLANAMPFKNCTEARQAGYEDISSSSDYYGSWLDRDGDGIACEST